MSLFRLLPSHHKKRLEANRTLVLAGLSNTLAQEYGALSADQRNDLIAEIEQTSNNRINELADEFKGFVVTNGAIYAIAMPIVLGLTGLGMGALAFGTGAALPIIATGAVCFGAVALVTNIMHRLGASHLAAKQSRGLIAQLRSATDTLLDKATELVRGIKQKSVKTAAATDEPAAVAKKSKGHGKRRRRRRAKDGAVKVDTKSNLFGNVVGPDAANASPDAAATPAPTSKAS